MNTFMQEQWPTVEGTHAMRDQLLGTLSDADLAFNPGGKNMTLGQLCRELGEIEYSYLQSLKTLTQDWSYRNTEAGLDGSVERLLAWYHAMDGEIKETLAGFSDDEMKQVVERGFQATRSLQMEIYLQALLIFFGKATIFVRAMDRALPEQIEQWIG